MPIFEAYSDESGFPSGRYQAIAVVSGSGADLAELRELLSECLARASWRELKFTRVRGDSSHSRCAMGFLEHTVEFARARRIRVDTLVWDMHDGRHAITGRDDVACLERMYYHVLTNMARRWRQEAWRFYPDEQSSVNFLEIRNYLNMTISRRPKRGQPSLLQLFRVERHAFRFKELEPTDSRKEPLIQLADLFAGMACFSRQDVPNCCKWLRTVKEGHLPLPLAEFPAETSPPPASKCCRYELIGHLHHLCRKHRLSVDLHRRGYLWTPRPTCAINFWHYKPQRPNDKAPLRRR